ncbi:MULTISPECIES: cell division protein FtsQ [Pantoea]|uniref:Cell division protein FtsQ n=1 Tax=Candidatus Pantoea multigeneris TaxID=2608357 RepID=A0ABX0RES1_9GAMM|nr:MULTISPECIES: cell division protein FtsQ [Pantoea]NIF23128.1 cell division protein FtsQ [Pantoea multigeneris]
MSQAALNVRNNREPQERASSGRSNGARLFGMVFLLLVLGVMAAGGVVVVKWMNDASRLPLSKLVVTGETHYTTNDDIRQAILSLGPPGTFMSQDVNVLLQQIERLPWIKQVSVRKQWPDELKINLVEYVAVARWNDQKMVDADGTSFGIPASQMGKGNLPMLYGPEGSESEVLAGYHQMSDVLKAGKYSLKAASMTARRSWQLITSDDVRIELGRTDVMKRLNRFIVLYPDLLQEGQNEHKHVSYVDLRYDSGAAVGWIQDPIEPQDSKQHQNQAQVKQQ